MRALKTTETEGPKGVQMKLGRASVEAKTKELLQRPAISFFPSSSGPNMLQLTMCLLAFVTQGHLLEDGLPKRATPFVLSVRGLHSQPNLQPLFELQSFCSRAFAYYLVEF